MAVFPEQIPDHPGKNLPVGERPIGRSQSGIMARDERSGNYQKKGGASDKDRETMKTLVHKSVASNQ
jgi:hypothetical protein